jgi:hypothetical protein
VLEDPVAEWASWGHRLDRAPAELSWWVEGTSYARRQVIVRGPLLAGSYGGSGEPLTATIEPQPQGDGGTIDTTGLVYSTRSVPTATVDERSLGAVYPLVVGRPFVERRDVAAGVPFRSRPFATKGVIWQVDTGNPEQARVILLCRGHIPDGEAVTLSWTDGDDGAADGTQTFDGTEIFLERDEQGNPVSLIDVQFAGLTPTQRTSRTWWVRWDSASGGTTRSPGAVETITRRYTGADTPIDETLTTTRAGDHIVRSSVQVITGFTSAPTLDLDVIRPTVLPLLDLSGGPLASPGTIAGLGAQTLRAPYRVRLQATGATGEALVRLEIRRAPRPSDGLSTLGELALWLVERSGQRADLGAWAAAVPSLAVPIGGELDPSRLAWDALLEDVLPLAPVSIRTGPLGATPVLWRWWATAEDAEARLRVGYDGIVRLPDVRAARPDGEVSTSVQMRYAYDARAGRYTLVATLSGAGVPASPLIETRVHVFGTQDSAISRQVYGARVLRLDSRLVYATETAAWVARWRLAAEGWAHRIVQIEGPQHLGHLMPGAVVTLTDASIHLSSGVALVTGRRLTDTGRVGLTLALVDGVASTRTTAGPTADSGPPYRTGGPTPQGQPPQQ